MKNKEVIIREAGNGYWIDDALNLYTVERGVFVSVRTCPPKKSLFKRILYSNPVQGFICAVLFSIIFFGIILLIAWTYSLVLKC